MAQATFSGLIANQLVDNLNVTYGGAGYSAPPVVSITPNGGSGSGAAATAVVQNGVITGLVLTNAGTGFNRNPSFSVVTTAAVTLTNNVNITSTALGGVLFYNAISGTGNLTTNGTTPIILNPSLGDNRSSTSTYQWISPVA